jgi:hypothetical protein
MQDSKIRMGYGAMREWHTRLASSHEAPLSREPRSTISSAAEDTTVRRLGGANMSAADSLGKIMLDDTELTFRKQKELAERAMAQVDDEQFFRTIDAESNSIAIIAKHVGGNLRSRWTDFLTTDGEKPDRDRDGEFIAPDSGGRARVMEVWNDGWAVLFSTFATLHADDLTATVRIRSEAMTAVAAMHRAMAHVAQHVGQIVLLAKHYRSSDWKTLSIPRGQSSQWLNAPPSHP